MEQFNGNYPHFVLIHNKIVVQLLNSNRNAPPCCFSKSTLRRRLKQRQLINLMPMKFDGGSTDLEL